MASPEVTQRPVDRLVCEVKAASRNVRCLSQGGCTAGLHQDYVLHVASAAERSPGLSVLKRRLLPRERGSQGAQGFRQPASQVPEHHSAGQADHKASLAPRGAWPHLTSPWEGQEGLRAL